MGPVTASAFWFAEASPVMDNMGESWAMTHFVISSYVCCRGLGWAWSKVVKVRVWWWPRTDLRKNFTRRISSTGKPEVSLMRIYGLQQSREMMLVQVATLSRGSTRRSSSLSKATGIILKPLGGGLMVPARVGPRIWIPRLWKSDYLVELLCHRDSIARHSYRYWDVDWGRWSWCHGQCPAKWRARSG